jgi:predicted TIM-barrel fold metal-dependent hydrolase
VSDDKEAADRLLDILSLVPTSRVMYGSDGWIIPEVHWLAAKIGRETVYAVMRGLVDEGLYSEHGALEAARDILTGNARELYRLQCRNRA